MPQRPAVLPPELVGALGTLADKLDRGERVEADVSTIIELFGGLDPAAVANHDWAIAEAARLRHAPPPPAFAWPFTRRRSHGEQLLRTPGLEQIFLFHRDGRLREAALLRITGGLPDAFLFAAVVWRLNDWAPQVRAAAMRCAGRSFPATDAEVVARAGLAILLRQRTWRRWSEERTLVDAALAREDVAERVARLLAESRRGPLASTLRWLLRTPALDLHLSRLAETAAQPSIRAVALSTLIDGEATWPDGHAWQWVDKPNGVRRRVVVLGRRPVPSPPPLADLIGRGMADGSAAVRRAALAGVIRHLLGTAEGHTYATRLTDDPSPSVREKAEFVLRTPQARA